MEQYRVHDEQVVACNAPLPNLLTPWLIAATFVLRRRPGLHDDAVTQQASAGQHKQLGSPTDRNACQPHVSSMPRSKDPHEGAQAPSASPSIAKQALLKHKWLRLDPEGTTAVLQTGKHALTQRLGVQARVHVPDADHSPTLT